MSCDLPSSLGMLKSVYAPAGIVVSPMVSGCSVMSSVASSAPVRQTLSKGTTPPQILRTEPSLGDFV